MRKLTALLAAGLVAFAALAGTSVDTSKTGIPTGGGGGSGTVTDLTVTPSNGVTSTVTSSTTTPAIALGLGAITPSSVSTGTVTATVFVGPGTGLTGTASALTVGTTSYATSAGTATVALNASTATYSVSAGTATVATTASSATALASGRTIGITGDLVYTSPSFDGSGNVTAAGTLATVNSNTGTFTASTITVNAKGLITAASSGTSGAGLGANTFTDAQTITQTATNTAALTVSGSTVSGAATNTFVTVTGTWNTTGSPTAIFSNITNTASNSASKLLDLQVGGTSMFSVRKDGVINVNSTGVGTGISATGATGKIDWTTSQLRLTPGTTAGDMVLVGSADHGVHVKKQADQIPAAEIRHDSATDLGGNNNARGILITGVGSFNKSAPMLTGTQTWNASTITFVAASLYVTDTSSAAASKLLDLGVGSTSKLAVQKDGSIITAGLHATAAVAPTVASTTTIAVTADITFVSGTAAIDTITAPSPISAAGGCVRLIPTGVFTTTTSGNIALGSTAVVSKVLTMCYDATTVKWYPSY